MSRGLSQCPLYIFVSFKDQNTCFYYTLINDVYSKYFDFILVYHVSISLLTQIFKQFSFFVVSEHNRCIIILAVQLRETNLQCMKYLCFVVQRVVTLRRSKNTISCNSILEQLYMYFMFILCIFNNMFICIYETEIEYNVKYNKCTHTAMYHQYHCMLHVCHKICPEKNVL